MSRPRALCRKDSRGRAGLGVLPDDLYIRIEPRPRIGRPAKHELETWRKGWDSNPRGSVNPLAVFKTAALNHSATLPEHGRRQMAHGDRAVNRSRVSLALHAGYHYLHCR